MNISSRHFNSKFAHSFDFHCLTNFAKNINLSWMVSLWCELLCKRPIYTFKCNQWIKIWWKKFDLECYYWYSFTPIQSSKLLAKTGTLNAGISELIPKKNHLKFVTLHNILSELPSWILCSELLLMKPSDALQNSSILY